MSNFHDKDQAFIEEVFEIAFGDNAIYRDFTFEDVLKKLREYSDRAFDEDEEHLRQLKEQGLNGYDKIESEVQQ